MIIKEDFVLDYSGTSSNLKTILFKRFLWSREAPMETSPLLSIMYHQIVELFLSGMHRPSLGESVALAALQLQANSIVTAATSEKYEIHKSL